MKINFFTRQTMLCGIMILSISAAQIHAQDNDVLINFRYETETPLGQVLTELIRKFQLSIVFMEQDVEGHNFSGGCDACTIDEALRQILREDVFVWARADSQIIVNKVKKTSEQQGTIEGVVSAMGVPLPGANVFIFDNRYFGIATGADGAFSFQAPAGKYDLHFRLLGYKTKIIKNIKVKPGESTRIIAELSTTEIFVGDVVIVIARKGRKLTKDDENKIRNAVHQFGTMMPPRSFATFVSQSTRNTNWSQINRPVTFYQNKSFNYRDRSIYSSRIVSNQPCNSESSSNFTGHINKPFVYVYNHQIHYQTPYPQNSYYNHTIHYQALYTQNRYYNHPIHYQASYTQNSYYNHPIPYRASYMQNSHYNRADYAYNYVNYNASNSFKTYHNYGATWTSAPSYNHRQEMHCNTPIHQIMQSSFTTQRSAWPVMPRPSPPSYRMPYTQPYRVMPGVP